MPVPVMINFEFYIIVSFGFINSLQPSKDPADCCHGKYCTQQRETFDTTASRVHHHATMSLLRASSRRFSATVVQILNGCLNSLHGLRVETIKGSFY